jgi:hypothetical protein
MREQLAAYALGALEEGEAAEVRAHLLDCAECQAEYSGYNEVAAHLAERAPRRAPPPALRSRVLAAVDREARSQQGTAPRPGRFRLVWLWGGFAFVLIFVQAWLLNEIISLREHLVEQQKVLSVMLSTDLEPVELVFSDPSAPANGSFRYEQELNLGLLNYYKLPQPEPGTSYQCWFEYAGAQAVPCGRLPLDANGHGLQLVQVPTPIPDAVLVTVEEGAVNIPTGRKILEAKIPREE